MLRHAMRCLTHRRLLPLLLVPVVLGTGCVRHRIQSEVSEDEQVIVRVENQNFSLVRVYASAGSIRQWIGSVTSGSTDQLSVPGAMLHGPTSLMFTAEAVQTGGHYDTPLIVVKPGNVVTLQV